MPTLKRLLTGRPVRSLPGSASTLEAARAMTAHHVGALLVVDPQGRPLGIFTERDLMTRVIVPGFEPAQTRIESVMTRELLAAGVDELIDTALREMQRRHVRHLPIVDREGRALAMLSLRDLLRFHLAEREHEVEAMHEYIAGADVPVGDPPPRPPAA